MPISERAMIRLPDPDMDKSHDQRIIRRLRIQATRIGCRLLSRKLYPAKFV